MLGGLDPIESDMEDEENNNTNNNAVRNPKVAAADHDPYFENEMQFDEKETKNKQYHSQQRA